MMIDCLLWFLGVVIAFRVYSALVVLSWYFLVSAGRCTKEGMAHICDNFD